MLNYTPFELYLRISITVSEMTLKLETLVFPKRRDNSPTPDGNILLDVVNSLCQLLVKKYQKL
jgi:hypothetical protein